MVEQRIAAGGADAASLAALIAESLVDVDALTGENATITSSGCVSGGASGAIWNECSSGPFTFQGFSNCPSVPYVLTGLPRSKIVPGTDKALPENSQQNLNKK